MGSSFKPSVYNVLFQDGSKCLLYNTFSTGLMELDDDRLIAGFNGRVAKGDPLRDITPDELRVLRSNGFIVDQDVDELDMVRYRYRKGVYDNQGFFVQLLPTTGCNFICPYCFERSKVPEVMGEEDCLEIERFIVRHLREEKPQDMQLGWYGGEPLLCIEVIERLTRFCDEQRQLFGVKKTGMTYVVTNGYLLDEAAASRLGACGVESVQITLDGGRAEHDAQRHLADGGGTFDRVLQAVYTASAHFPEVIVRFNIDRRNYGSVQALVGEEPVFDKDNVLIFPGYLKSYLSGGTTREKDPDLFTGAEFREIQEGLLKRNKREMREDLLTFPAKLNNCTADASHGFNIGPGCKVYKCLERIEPSEAVGVIEGGEFKANGNYWPWLMDEPFRNVHCSKCVYLPMCMGGCPSQRRLIGVPNNEVCGFWKEYLHRKLKAVAAAT